MNKKDQKHRRIAKEITDENPDLDAPLNDIESCVADVLGTGLSEDRARTIVPKMITSSSSRDDNGDRQPNSNEILLYELPDGLEDLYYDPE